MQSVFTEEATTKTRAMDPVNLYEQGRAFMEDGARRQAITASSATADTTVPATETPPRRTRRCW